MKEIKELDTVALLRDVPEKNLSKGQVGTVVKKLDPITCEIEFTNTKGETTLSTSIKTRDLILLRFEPVSA